MAVICLFMGTKISDNVFIKPLFCKSFVCYAILTIFAFAFKEFEMYRFRKIALLFLGLFFCMNIPCKALDVYQFINARTAAMGDCVSVLPAFANPSGYAFCELRQVSLHYLNRYGIKELSTYAGSFNFPNSYLNVGAYISRYGFKAYNENLFSVNLYRKLSSFLALGVRVNYLNIHYSDTEPNKSLFTADIGVLARPADKLTLSVLAVNPFLVKMKSDSKKMEIPVVLSLGASYEILPALLMCAEVEKDFSYPVVCKVGMEYLPIRQLSLRAGMYGKPFTPSFGVGLQLSFFSLDLAFSRHPVLGFRSSCDVSFSF